MSSASKSKIIKAPKVSNQKLFINGKWVNSISGKTFATLKEFYTGNKYDPEKFSAAKVDYADFTKTYIQTYTEESATSGRLCRCRSCSKSCKKSI